MGEASYQNIQLLIDEGLATLTLDRPNRLNSFNAKMHWEVKEAFEQIKIDNSVRCLLITGSGKGFCAGQDLSARPLDTSAEMPDLAKSIEKNWNPLVRNITKLEMPVLCAVNGVAAGAGANIALACDIVIAARSASFIQAFNKLGLVPDCGGTWNLPRLVGQSRALSLCLLGEKITAEDAASMGMIYKVLEDEKLMPEAIALGKKLAKAPTIGIALTRHAIRESSNNTFDQQLDLERDLQSIAGRTDDYREGVDAFINKRPAVYHGR
jgi:2-(1,2-epoxy-1,2-dihydrophenyl)acetyl-CoA isomerase